MFIVESTLLGSFVGAVVVGVAVVGAAVVGVLVGTLDGALDGALEGVTVGTLVGAMEGAGVAKQQAHNFILLFTARVQIGVLLDASGTEHFPSDGLMFGEAVEDL